MINYAKYFILSKKTLIVKLEDLFLKKEELPILRETCFQLPVYPELLREDINIKKDLAHLIFPQIVKEWHEDLQKHTSEMKPSKEKDWYKEIFLREPKIETERGKYILMPLHWECDVFIEDNGFASGLSISRNAGGSLCPPDLDYICPPVVNFSKEKFEAYQSGLKIEGVNGVYAFVYGHHNINYFPGALFLRNWGILYLNEAMKEVIR